MLEKAGLTAKPSDCHFGMFECTYLGHVVGKGIGQPEPSKVQAVMTFPVHNEPLRAPAGQFPSPPHDPSMCTRTSQNGNRKAYTSTVRSSRNR